MPARIAGICGLLAFVKVNLGWIAGGFAQPPAFSWADDDISDLGATTADSAWLYNQIGANLTGLLVVGLALGLWRALSPDVLGRLGACALLVAGVGSFLDGFFRLDCRGIDALCTNDSWHSHAHKIESGFTGAATLVAPLLLGLAFRRIPSWRDSWLPSLATIPAIIAANAVFSTIGDGAATRAGTVVAFLWIAFLGARLLQKGERSEVPDVGHVGQHLEVHRVVVQLDLGSRLGVDLRRLFLPLLLLADPRVDQLAHRAGA